MACCSNGFFLKFPSETEVLPFVLLAAKGKKEYTSLPYTSYVLAVTRSTAAVEDSGLAGSVMRDAFFCTNSNGRPRPSIYCVATLASLSGSVFRIEGFVWGEVAVTV